MSQPASRPNIQLDVGVRVTVYWPGDDQWYKGTVVKRKKKNKLKVLVKYDDGDVEWMDSTTTRYRGSSKPDIFLKEHTLSTEKKKQQIAKLHIGSRLSVWWPHEKQYYTGGLKKIRTLENQPHFIEYDDGDTEWTNLLHRKFWKLSRFFLRLARLVK